VVHDVPTGQVDTPPAEQVWMHVCPCDVCVHACDEEQLGGALPPELEEPHATTRNASAATGAPTTIHPRSIAR
jgi:hypothetical protein